MRQMQYNAAKGLDLITLVLASKQTDDFCSMEEWQKQKSLPYIHHPSSVMESDGGSSGPGSSLFAPCLQRRGGKSPIAPWLVGT